MRTSVVAGALIAVLFALPSLQSQATSAKRESQTVVFVCEHGTVKSVVAAKYFNRVARQRHLPIRAVSRGTNLESIVPRVVHEGLARDGFDLRSFKPTAVDKAELQAALLVVTFDRPDVASIIGSGVPVVAWDNFPAVSANYNIARDSIRLRVAHLVDSLAHVPIVGRHPH